MKNDKEKLEKEIMRLNSMKEFEYKYKDMILAGVDEAGRGPLAGPVVAGCVVLDKNVEILYVNDSKKISEKKREELYIEIKEKALSYGVGIVDNEMIDKVNILEATHIAMKEAYVQCDNMYYDKYHEHIECLLVDALHIKNIDIKQVGIIKGDALSVSIASASILAKITRDHIMMEYEKIYPEYGFGKHKAYGTKAHMEVLKKIGPCPIHRKSFLSFLYKK